MRITRRRRWRREGRPVPGDVRISTCDLCNRGIWASQMRAWCGSARFEWPRTGECQECQGKGPR